MEDLETVKQRIKKLLALSKSSNENEAASALIKANEMMENYNLSSLQFSEYTEAKVKGTKRPIRWRVLLANAVENLYATYHYTDPTGTLFFIGEELDVFMSTEMYKYLAKTIDRMAKQNIRNCWWTNAEHTLCSHCSEKEIKDDPKTEHRVNDNPDWEPRENRR